MRAPKTGRRASQDERDRAAQWVRIYELAFSAPDGRYCLNPEDHPDERQYIRADDPRPLVALLGEFARNGTFAVVENPAGRMLLHMEFKELRQDGHSYEAAIKMLAERHHTVSRNMERWLSEE